MCVSKIHDFIVPHLANKYFTHMGIPIEELDRQVDALCDVHRTGAWAGALFEPETRASGFQWSKDLYDKPDNAVLQRVPRGTRHLLSVGVGLGLTERALNDNGVSVYALAVDSVFGRILRAHGLNAIEGGLDTLERCERRHFDVVLAIDVLHLVPDPTVWLSRLKDVLSPRGVLIATMPNTLELPNWLRDLRHRRLRSLWPRHTTIGAHPVSERRLRGWCRRAGLEVRDVTSLPAETSRLRGRMVSRIMPSLSPMRHILTAKAFSKGR